MKLITNDPATAIAIVIVNWNGWRLTLDCIASLRSSERSRWHLFLVDNASTDDSLEHLSDLGENITVLCSPINGGWTGGNNLGIRHALNAGHEFLFILNNDATVLPDTIATLQRTFEEHRDELPILGPVHTTAQGDRYDFTGASIDDYTGIPRQNSIVGVAAADLKPVYETCFVKGAGMFVHRRHFEAVGLFDDDFYLNYDETDWSFRARRLGFKSYMVRDSIIRHAGSASIGGGTSPLHLYFMVRNGLLFSERHSSVRQRLRVARNFYWWARRMVDGHGKFRWILRFLRSKASLTIAFRYGVRDYTFRQFGDCPKAIRALQASK